MTPHGDGRSRVEARSTLHDCVMHAYVRDELLEEEEAARGLEEAARGG